MNANTKVVGVDFGTTRSHFCICPGDAVKPQGIAFKGDGHGLATAVLYRGDGKGPLIGDTAIEEWSESPEHSRAGWRLRTQFKPEIVASRDARRHAVDFLAGSLPRVQDTLGSDTAAYVFGVPSEAGPDFAAALQAIAREAGYGEITTMDEPVGALWHHVSVGDIPLDRADGGVLVIDFGGGTCDFAYLRRFEVQSSWGDMAYGGRLFDDLFFQWFLERNPGSLARIVENHDVDFVHLYRCRQAKEAFSQTMSQDRYAKCRKVIPGYGSFGDMTWEDFTGRARAYTPTERLRDTMAASGQDADEWSKGAPLDLLDRFHRLLKEGVEEHGVRPNELQRVILTGGSSQWLFVRDMVQAVLKIPAARIVQSPNPTVTIGTGLAIHRALNKELQEKIGQLRAGAVALVSARFVPALKSEIAATMDNLCRDVSLQIVDGVYRQGLRELCANGGCLREAETWLEQQAIAVKHRLSGIVKSHEETVNKALGHHLGRLVGDWLNEKGLRWDDCSLAVEIDLDKNCPPHTSLEPRLPNGWLRLLVGTATATALVIGLALGGLRGAIITWALGAAPFFYYRDKLAAWTKGLPIPGRAGLGKWPLPKLDWILDKIWV